MTKTGFCVAMLVVGTLAGCHSGAKLNQEGTATQGNSANSQPANVAPVAVDELNNPNGPLAKRSVYFDFDSYSVKDDYQLLLEAHAKYLRTHPGRHVLIQGSTDERGTSETLGVPGSQLEAVSLGKEKPIAMGHDEASWAQNRRADLVYQ